jgi:LPS export ABC transporter protein LptC
MLFFINHNLFMQHKPNLVNAKNHINKTMFVDYLQLLSSQFSKVIGTNNILQLQIKARMVAVGLVIIASAWWLLVRPPTSVLILTPNTNLGLLQNQSLIPAAYTEKINNFALQQFDQQHQLTQFIQAEQYFNFKQPPALLLNPKVSTYNAAGEAAYLLVAQRANYAGGDEIVFIDQVNVSSKHKIEHKLQAKELIMNHKNSALSSEQEVVYVDVGVKINAQGMHMDTQTDDLLLMGKVMAVQGDGSKLLTKDLVVESIGQEKYYHSQYPSEFISAHNIINSSAGVNMNVSKSVIKLFGKVRILQNFSTIIDTFDLTINQAHDNEIYHTKNAVHYQSSIANIHAIGMDYDAKSQTIKLSKQVRGVYE